MDDYLRLRQICVVAPELEPAVDDIAAIFGLEVCHRDPKVEVFGVTNALFVAGTTFIEIIAPFQENTAAGRFLDRSKGRGGYIAIFDCPDPDARQKHAAAMGVPTAFEIDRPGSYRCVQLHPRECRATMLEFDRTTGGEDLTGRYSPAGGDGWQKYIDTTTTRAITGIEAISPNPGDLAAHWAAILQREVDASGETPTIHIEGADIRIAGNPDDGRELLETVLVEVVDPEAVMAVARQRGKATGPRSIGLCGMTFRLV
jgi:hypothetical protein